MFIHWETAAEDLEARDQGCARYSCLPFEVILHTAVCPGLSAVATSPGLLHALGLGSVWPVGGSRAWEKGAVSHLGEPTMCQALCICKSSGPLETL